jgi:alpha-1,3-rhamnosyl/mannosyltransferase
VLVGDNRLGDRYDLRALIRSVGHGDRIDWREYVPDAELDALYAQARVFVFLSEYEGFGLTPMEAIAHGVPAILLDTPVTREIYGEGVRRVGSIDELPEALTELLTDDHAHAACLAAGQAWLPRYSWADSARIVTRALEEAAGR